MRVSLPRYLTVDLNGATLVGCRNVGATDAQRTRRALVDDARRFGRAVRPCGAVPMSAQGAPAEVCLSTDHEGVLTQAELTCGGLGRCEPAWCPTTALGHRWGLFRGEVRGQLRVERSKKVLGAMARP